MRFSRLSTEGPSLRTVDVLSGPRDGVTAFPPPELPGFAGTTQSSDSHRVVDRSCLFDLSGILKFP